MRAARSSACSAPGSTSCTRGGTASLFDRVRGPGLLVSELGYGVQPRRRRSRCATASSRVSPSRGGGGGHAEGRRAHHRRARARVRPHGDGVSRIAPQPVGRGHQLAALRRRLGRARAVRRAGPARVRPARAAARLSRATGRRGRRGARGLPRRAGDARPAGEPRRAHAVGVVAAVRALERGGWMERARGLCWPR